MIEAFIVISLGMALEGVAYAHAPGRVRQLMAILSSWPAERVRNQCAIAVASGIALLIAGPNLLPGAAGHLIAGAGFVLAFEGAVWVAAPERMQEVARLIVHLDLGMLQRAGLAIGGLGLGTAALMHFGMMG